MRIITGKLKGRKIPTPKTDKLRPTSDRTKEGLFSVIQARTWLENTRTLDLFAGSGNLGFEAISRGAATCLFVDQEKEHLNYIDKLAGTFGISSQVQTIRASVEKHLEKNGGAYDFIFADPPYDYHLMEEMIEIVLENSWLSSNGWFILEHDKRHDFSSHQNCVFSKAYGRTIVSIFTHDSADF